VDEDLLPIGRFARLAGLSVGALRHYDELDLIRPARTDPFTGYRSYRRDQLETARTIVAMRDLEVPLETIRELLATDDPGERRRILVDHRSRIEARTFRLQRVLHILGQLTSEDPTAMTAATTPLPTELDPATRRKLAADLFNHTWTLLEKPDRTSNEDDEMIHAAHASRFHWGEVGEPANLARGEWQCARVYSVLGRAEPALYHARRCLEINQANGSTDWDLAAAYEAMARAYLTAGDAEQVAAWKAKAVEALDGIADKEEREIIESDIATLP
jgi:DNA-binding transcriptional MerR regulator